MQSKLTLLIPGLLTPPQSLQRLPASEKPACSFLNRFFSRARQTTLPVSGFYSTLFYLFDIKTNEQDEHPVAALTYQIDTNSQNDEWCLRCDPVYIHPDMDRAILMGHGELSLTAEETEQLVMVINAHVEQDGWQLEAHAVDRWYVRGIDKNRITTTPPQNILGQDIKHDLPKGQDSSYWCSIMNECQMLLHDLPVNQQRQARGLLPVNSLWFWGGGQLPESTVCQYDKVFADDALIEGIAMLSNCSYGRSEDLWQEIQKQGRQHYLLFVEELMTPAVTDDLFAWIKAVSVIEQNVIQKTLSLLKDKQLSEVNLLTSDGQSFQLTPALLRRWWKRQAKFSMLVEEAGD